MNAPNYLIDTNVFIRLEDPSEIDSELAALLQLAARYHVNVFVHEASLDDIARDRNAARQRVTRSKVEKFQILRKVRGLNERELSSQFGSLRKPNDIVDATLLHSLLMGAADFLVTEDRKLHERVRRYASLYANRVLYVADAVALLRAAYEPRLVAIPFVEELEANCISLTDPIFSSLREGYPNFDTWWKEKCVKTHRKCWAVTGEAGIAGLVVRKTESAGETDATLPGKKILKICTFKVRREQRGIKLGELLLKQVLWFAHSNDYDVVYLTTFSAQSTLIDLIEYYGFVHTYTKGDGELVYEKHMNPKPSLRGPGNSYFDFDRIAYPRFYSGSDVKAYGVPVRSSFHKALFPELFDQSQQDLFGKDGFGPGTSGNTIRKVYLCRAKANIDPPGSMLFFYKGKSMSLPSQAITTLGIFENCMFASSTEELRRLAGGRSVYSDTQLVKMNASVEAPVKVINFLLIGHAKPSWFLKELRMIGVVNKQPSQSIFGIDRNKLPVLLERFGNPGGIA